MTWRPLLFATAGLILCSCQKPPVRPPFIEPTLEANRWRRLHGPDFATAPNYLTVAFVIGDSVIVIDIDSGTVVRHTIQSDTQGFTDVAFSPDGRWMAVMEAGASVSSRVFLFNRDDPDSNLGLHAVGHYPDGGVGGMCFTSDSRWIAGAADYASRVFNLWQVPSCALSPNAIKEGKYLQPQNAGLKRSEDRKSLLSVEPGRRWRFDAGEALQASFGFLNSQAIGVLGLEHFFILRASDGKPIVRVSTGIQSSGWHPMDNPFEAAKPLFAEESNTK